MVMPVRADGPDPRPAPQGPDEDCLRTLTQQGVRYDRAEAAGAMITPIQLRGPVGALTLFPRGRRSPIMDCQLARALWDAQPIFQELGIQALGFSAAYDYRTRRGSSQLSGHAHGVAIDVHVLRGTFGEYDVARDFEVGVGEWKGLKAREGAAEACIGAPTRDAGRTLRALVCRLKLHSAFRIVVTPDDDSDHQDHLHLEAFPDPLARARGILGVPGTAPIPPGGGSAPPAAEPPRAAVEKPAAPPKNPVVKRRPSQMGQVTQTSARKSISNLF